MPEDIPEDMPDRMPEDMSEYMPEDMPDRMPEDMSDRMPEDLPDRMPEDMPDRMPNRMSEDMSDRMPEDVPVRTCINVMVGITRSKVIFRYFACAQAGRHSETLQLLFPSHAETKIVEACCNRWGQSPSCFHVKKENC